jgi:hypothetical protein
MSRHVTFMTIDDAGHYTPEQRAEIIAAYRTSSSRWWCGGSNRRGRIARGGVEAAQAYSKH